MALTKSNPGPAYLFWVLVTLLSHYRRHPGQTLFMAVGLITGVALWSAVQLINDHAKASYGQADQLLGAEAGYWIRDRRGQGVSVTDYIALRRAGFIEVYPVIDSSVASRDGQLISIIATDLLALPRPKNAPGDFADVDEGIQNGELITQQQWLPLIQSAYQAWFPENLALQLGIEAGESMPLSNGRSLPPAVIQSRSQQGLRVFMDIGAARSVLARESLSYLSVTRLSAERRALLESLLPDSLKLIDNRQALDLSQLTESLHTQLTAMGLLSFAVGLFIVFNAVRFSLLARLGTINTLREMGVSVRVLAAVIVLETLLWSVLGTIFGIIVGYALSGLLLPTFAGSLQALFGAVVESDIQLRASQVLIAWGLTLIGLIFALAAPLWTAANTSILASRSLSEQWDLDAKIRRQLAGCGCLLLATAGLAYWLSSTVTHGFIVLTFILFGGALILPSLLQLSIKLATIVVPDARWRTRWAMSDALAQLPQLRIALMALLLTLTANIGVTTLVDSFRIALSSWLEVRLSADIYLQSNSLNMKQLVVRQQSDKQSDWYVASHERMLVSGRWQDRPARVQGLDVAAPDSRQMVLAAQVTNGLERWARSEGNIQPILANEQVRYLGNTDLGDVIRLDTNHGKMPFQIVGFFHDYGSPYYRFYLPKEVLGYYWHDASVSGLALWVKDGAVVEAEQAMLDAGARPGDWIRQADIRRVSLAIFDRTFAITRALNGLTLLVAGVALLAALMAIHMQRLPHYAHWRSLGLTYFEGFGIVAVPLLILVLLTGILALPLGWLMSWMLIHELNVLAFGWTMPLVWSWSPILELALVTLGVVTWVLAFAALRVRQTLPTALKQLGSELV